VPCNSSGSSDGSSRANNVVDDSLNNSWEWLSLNGHSSSSSNLDDPRRSESASAEGEPVGCAQISSIYLDVVEITGTATGDKDSVTVFDLVVSICAKSREVGLNGSVVRLCRVESSPRVNIVVDFILILESVP